MLASITLLAAAAFCTGAEQAAVREHVYKTTPQGTLKMLVHRPPDWKASDRRPAIVFFFGGGWTGGSIGQFEDQAAYLATRGLVTARADYRVKSRHGVTPVACVEDAKSAVRWLRAHADDLGIDPKRIVAAGGSAGGHVAACTALVPNHEAEGEDTTLSSRPSALVLFNPVLDMRQLDKYAKRLGPEARAAISPIRYVNKETPPAILFYGTKDRFLADGRAMLAEAKQHANRVELYTAEGQPHAFFNRPPWKQLTAIAADRFLASLGYVTGEPTIAPPEGTAETLRKVE
jgi:acetyl esterase/lipase